MSQLSKRPPEGEEGFVLLAALWLLILVGSIAAFLMVRSLQAATEVRDQQLAAQQRFALDGAVQTYVAEILINGPRSQWALIPATGTMEIGGQKLSVVATPESGRLDMNAADLSLIDDVFRGLGASASARELLRAELEARRKTSMPIRSIAELQSVLQMAKLHEEVGVCLPDLLTPFSGLTAPRLELAPIALREAMERVGRVDGVVEPRPTPVSAMQLVRLHLSADSQQLTAVIRITGVKNEPYMVQHWSQRATCR